MRTLWSQAAELKESFTIYQMREAMFSVSEVLHAGYTLDELRKARHGNGFLWAEKEFTLQNINEPWICARARDGVHHFEPSGFDFNRLNPFKGEWHQCAHCKGNKKDEPDKYQKR